MAEKKETTLDERVKGYKGKYQKVFQYDVPTDGGVETFILRQPDRKTIAAAAITANGDNIKNNEIILQNCILEGDKELLKDDSVFYGMSQLIGDMVAAKVGTIKEL